ncbi:hypothetical protein ACE1TF_08520 [Geomicrobium sp. JSM 1781026]|nr:MULTISPECIES: hypothetical protein [unclassified Geomicrobium]
MVHEILNDREPAVHSKKQNKRKKLTGKLKKSIRDYLRKQPVPRYE